MRSDDRDLVCHLLVAPVIYYYFQPGEGQLFLMWGWFVTSLGFALAFLIDARGFLLRKFALVANLTGMFVFSGLATYFSLQG